MAAGGQPARGRLAEEEITTHPPVSLACAPLAARLCTHLQDNVVAARAGRVDIDCVYGDVYARREGPFPVLAEKQTVVPLYDWRVRWMVAGQLAVTSWTAQSSTSTSWAPESSYEGGFQRYPDVEGMTHQVNTPDRPGYSVHFLFAVTDQPIRLPRQDRSILRSTPISLCPAARTPYGLGHRAGKTPTR